MPHCRMSTWTAQPAFDPQPCIVTDSQSFMFATRHNPVVARVVWVKLFKGQSSADGQGCYSSYKCNGTIASSTRNLAKWAMSPWLLQQDKNVVADPYLRP
jgi:hypothetical protein